MATTLVESVEARRIGSVIYVSPNEVKIRLDFDSPESVALNTGTPVLFPKVNSYLLIPGDCSQLVCQVTWAELSDQGHYGPKGDKTFVALPFASRLLSLSPLGMLSKTDKGQYKFSRGADSLPAIGEQVLLPTVDQVKAIVTSGDNLRVKIGTSPLAENADVKVDPDRLFGRHLAILGNTGSGKSCSVAGIVRWALESAKEKVKESGQKANSRFVILDPNGEYSRCFQDMGEDVELEVLSVSKAPMLKVPFWMWTGTEWCAFAHASQRTQDPLLRRALRDVKSGLFGDDALRKLLRERLRSSFTNKLFTITNWINEDFPKKEATRFGQYLESVLSDIRELQIEDGALRDAVESVVPELESLIQSKRSTFDKRGETIIYFKSFENALIQPLIAALKKVIEAIGYDETCTTFSEDAPIPFKFEDFTDHLSGMATAENVSQFIDFLVMRIRAMRTDGRLMKVVSDEDGVLLDKWLDGFLCANKAKVTVVDLSLVPAELIHIVAAVVARLIFDALQKYRGLNGVSLPTVLVMEEAHSFVRRYGNEEDGVGSATVCCKVFERIAREGRKFGLGLVLSSQRPSELSPTVLSQCNTFLLHRISNDKDQELVKRLLPDNLHGLMRDLPVLPSRQAILLGWAAELPVLVQMRELPKEQRPQSSDPDFWDVWTRKKARDVDWKKIADDWQGVSCEHAAEENAESEGSAADGAEEGN